MDNRRLPREEPSTYLRYLPAIYQDDPFLGRFLRIFEEINSPIQAMVDTLPEWFDPRLAPPTMLERLASWVGAQWPARLPEPRWRQLVPYILFLHRWRGTKRGVRLALEVATGQAPLITEYAEGLVLGPDATLGLNTALKEGKALHFQVVFDCLPEEVDRTLVQCIIGAYKPAHVSYSVAFRPR
jgi:phage tail-like protein